MDHEAFRELAAGAALDDLDARERSSLVAHLGACSPCRSDATALADTAGLLALVAPRRMPPASLRDSVMAAIAAAEQRYLGGATATMITLEAVGGAQGVPGPQVAFGELES
jgi:predicted anti-sigma-YlaC factor YlaD